MASYKSKRGARNISRARKKKRDTKKASFDADVSALEAETNAAREAAIRADIDKSIQKGGADIMPLVNKRNAESAVKSRKRSELEALGFGSTYPDMYAFGGPVGGKSAKGRDGIASRGKTKGPSRVY